jgi:hypothetical protein
MNSLHYDPIMRKVLPENGEEEKVSFSPQKSVGGGNVSEKTELSRTILQI